jgi:curli production assembly/transport component CsgG
MTKEKIEEIIEMKILSTLFIILLLGVNGSLVADEIVHKFKSPSFSGINTSAHYLTIENQEFNRKAAIKAEIKAYREELEREAENTTLARFIRNLESRIYAQLSRQLVDALFGEDPSTFGVLELMGNTIEYSVSDDGTMIKPTIAIYPNSFTDLTGQRKSNSTFALFSSAITQSPDAFLIRAFKHAADGNFFTVVERVGLDNLTKERQIIRTTRQDFDDERELNPLIFAGLLVQGGVISYDTNLKSGGRGARYLGVGQSRQYREDTVTVSLRLVSVNTGEVLMEVLTSKTILSVGVSTDIFRFYEAGTELVEVESGVAQNESVSIALQKAIETSVLEIVRQGIERRYWNYE